MLGNKLAVFLGTAGACKRNFIEGGFGKIAIVNIIRIERFVYQGEGIAKLIERGEVFCIIGDRFGKIAQFLGIGKKFAVEGL